MKKNLFGENLCEEKKAPDERELPQNYKLEDSDYHICIKEKQHQGRHECSCGVKWE